MNGEVFIDSNLILYLYSEDEPEKRRICQDLVNQQICLISTQVINEVSHVLHRKMGLSASEIAAVVDELLEAFRLSPIGVNTIKSALTLLGRYAYFYWDCLILASALEHGCALVYSEDMQHKQRINETLTILNPFMP